MRFDELEVEETFDFAFFSQEGEGVCILLSNFELIRTNSEIDLFFRQLNNISIEDSYIWWVIWLKLQITYTNRKFVQQNGSGKRNQYQKKEENIEKKR